MTDELTAAGLTIDSFEVRLAALNTALRAAISANLDLSTDQPTGQLTKIQTEKIQAIMELVRAINVSWHPDSATGASLTALAAVTGTQRRAATYGHVILDCNLDGGTLLSAGNVASVAGDATNRWVTDEEFIAPLGPAAQYDIAATCEVVGPIAAPLGTITVRATAPPGWNTVDNAAAADAGLAEENDTALRARREYEIALGGSTSVDAIRAELLDLVGMLQAIVTENTTAAIVDTIPPHSFESVIWDGAAPAVDDEDIAEAIFETKAGGIEAYGATVEPHEDEQGVSHAIGFTRADEQRITVEVTLQYTSLAEYVGDVVVEAAIETWSDANLDIGEDVYLSKISGVVIDLGGVANVSLVRLSIFPAGFAAADVAITARQIGTIDGAPGGDIVTISTLLP
jgi:uncharacterized phage protein gp47/JayE